MFTRRVSFIPALLVILILLPMDASLSLSSRAFAPALVQFRSQSHMLGFESEGLVVSNAAYALHVEFLGANHVEPDYPSHRTNDLHPPAVLTHVTYPNLWDGITLRYDAPAQGIVRSTYTLAPSARVADIQLRYNAPITVNADGSLSVSYANGQVKESAPVAWQDFDRERVPVTVAFVARGERQLGFALGKHDPHTPVVIDPVLTWNTFLGGKRFDAAYALALDTKGNAYVAGRSAKTWGTPVRAHTGKQDAFVTKLDADGGLVWNTFLGGAKQDGATGIAVNDDGSVYVGGWSSNTWGTPIRPFQTCTSQCPTDSFAAKLDPNGGLVWNTFLGGSDHDNALELDTDAAGNVLITGFSDASWGQGECSSCPIRPFSGVRDAYAAKLDPAGTLTWVTFLGGAQEDVGWGIAGDDNNNVFVTGQSVASWGDPVRAYSGDWDAFAAKLDANGALVWNTFLGTGASTSTTHTEADTSGAAENTSALSASNPASHIVAGLASESGYGITVDGNGNVLVSGTSDTTWGTPVRAHSNATDAFVAKLDAEGDLTWNTFLGGTKNDTGGSVTTDADGNIHVTGESFASWGMPVRSFVKDNDAFAAKLGPDGSLVSNTFLGGSGRDAGTGIAVNANGDILLAGHSTASWSFPVRPYTSGAIVYMDAFDGFAAKIPAVPGCAEKPDKPLFVRPKENSSHLGATLKLDWSDAACGDTYKVILRQDSTTGQVVLKEKGLTESWAATPNLNVGKSYYWRVFAANTFGKSKSDWFKFSIIGATVIVQNLTGGTLCYEVLNTGIGKKCYPDAGDYLYGTFFTGTYTWQASAPCGTDTNSLYYPPQTIKHWFSCDESAASPSSQVKMAQLKNTVIPADRIQILIDPQEPAKIWK